MTASTEPPVPSVNSSTPPNTSTAVILATSRDCAPRRVRSLVTRTVPFRDTPAGSRLTLHRLHSAGLVITWGATRVARCAQGFAERASAPSSSLPAAERSIGRAGQHSGPDRQYLQSHWHSQPRASPDGLLRCRRWISFPGGKLFVHAVGTFFNANVTALPGQSIVTPAGTVFTGGSASNYDFSTFFFAGLISDTPFDVATFGAALFSSSFNVDNLTFGSPAAVPEPSSVLLLGTGLAALAGAIWRRRRGRERSTS